MKTILEEQVFRIATLVPDARTSTINQGTAVNYHELQWCPNTGKSDDFVIAPDELPQTCFISNHRDEGKGIEQPNLLTKSCSKAVQQSYTASEDAATFLSGKSASSSSRKGSCTKATQAPDVSVEDAVFVLSKYGSANVTYRPTQYHAFKFSLPRTNFTDATNTENIGVYRQLLNIRQPGLQRSRTMTTTKDLGSFGAFDAIEICSGMCLSAEEDLSSCTKNGTIQPKQLALLPVSLCEKEIITRLSTTIANTAALYMHGSGSSRTVPLRINIDLPSVQYYEDAFNAFENGTCGPSDVLEWIAAIKSRRLLLFQAFKKAIEYGLRERGVPEDNVNITISCGLKAAGEEIFWKLRAPQQSNDWIQEVLSAVLHDENESWFEFMQLLSIDEQRPSTWREFNTLSYMYEVVKPVLRARSAIHLSSEDKVDHIRSEVTSPGYTHTSRTRSAPPSPPPGRTIQKDFFDPLTTPNSKAPPRILLLAIDDSDESRIYTKAYQALCRLSTSAARSPGLSLISPPPVISRILTICPAPQVIVGTSQGNVEWNRPSLWRASLRRDGEVAVPLRFRTDSGCANTDSDVLKKVYDRDLVTQLDTWLHK